MYTNGDLKISLLIHIKIILWKFHVRNPKNPKVSPVKFVFFLKSRLLFNPNLGGPFRGSFWGGGEGLNYPLSKTC